jgi:glutamate synthase domain-containing protein 1
MCGIMGFCDKTSSRPDELGPTMLRMLTALGRRGPDSAGIAFYSRRKDDGVTLRIKLGDRADFSARASAAARCASEFGAIGEQQVDAEYLRLVVHGLKQPTALQAAIEAIAPDVEVISMGRSLEIAKQVGDPERLDTRFHISRVAGSHAIAHTRLSTESRIDLSHSQPFWAHGTMDVASVHNGHITNYHKLRRQYEEEGVRFYTENDSEIIGVYLARALAGGATLHEALDESVLRFDGSFSYLAATADEIGFAKDRFGFKPLIVTESDDFVAFATEEHALRRAFGESVTTWEPPPGEVQTWPVDGRGSGRTGKRSNRADAAPIAAAAGRRHGNR